jgi:hypothetical protein
VHIVAHSLLPRFPGAAQHGAKRNDALQTRDRYKRQGSYKRQV